LGTALAAWISVSSTADTAHPLDADPQRAFGVVRQVLAFCALRPRGIGTLLYDAFNEWSADNAARLGAALSYYTLFSIAPILVVTVAIVGMVYGPAAAQGQIAPWLERLLGLEGARAAQFLLAHAANPTGGVLATIIGVLSLFLGASSVVNELRSSLDIVWKVGPGPSQTMSIGQAITEMFTARLYAFAIVLGAGILIILSIAASAIIAAAGTSLGTLPIPEAALQFINFLVGLAIATVMFTLVYKFVPDARLAWGDAAIGGGVTGLLFNVGGMVMSTFIGKTAGSGSVYGTAGGIIAMLLWVYYSAQVFLFGAELTRLFANQCGGRVLPRRRF
jgi:membrane protein